MWHVHSGIMQLRDDLLMPYMRDRKNKSSETTFKLQLTMLYYSELIACKVQMPCRACWLGTRWQAWLEE